MFFCIYIVSYSNTVYRRARHWILNNSSLIVITSVVAFALSDLSPFLYSRDNEVVQKLSGVRSCAMSSFYHNVPEKMICAVLDVW